MDPMPGGITRPTMGSLVVAVALALSCGLAHADASSDATALANGLATSATQVVSVGPVNVGPCTYAGGSGVVEQLSGDRGATWAAGPCVPDRESVLDLDPTNGLLVYGSSSASIVWLSPTGAVAADVPAPSQTSFVAADDGYAYVLGASGLERVARDGSASPCAAGRYTGGSGPPLVPLAGGILVGEPESPWAGTLSRDDCATFVPSADLASCGSAVQALGPYSVTCNTASTNAYLDVRFDHLLRTARVQAFDPSTKLDWTFQNDTLELTDELATATAPQSWPAATPYAPRPVAGDPPPSAALDGALAQLNARWRTPVGLPPLSWSGLAAQVAYDHAYEWQLAGVLPAPNAGAETPGAPGFTGADSLTRCRLAGIPTCLEFYEPGVTDPVAALTRVLADPIAIFAILTYPQIGLATTAAGTVVDVTAPSSFPGAPVQSAPPGSTSDFDLPPNLPTSPIRAWPPDGASDVPASWSNPGTLSFDPLAAAGDPAVVGYPMYVVADEPGTWQLLDPSGTALALTQYLMTTPSTTADFDDWAAYPVTPLTPGARYTIVLHPWIGPQQVQRFTVAGGAAVKAPARVVRCTVSVHQAVARAGIRMTFARRTSGCKGTRLQWRPRAPKPWRTIGAHGIVEPAKRVVYWRAIAGKRVLAHGRVVVRRPKG
jgi:hypothetical protein